MRKNFLEPNSYFPNLKNSRILLTFQIVKSRKFPIRKILTIFDLKIPKMSSLENFKNFSFRKLKKNQF